MSRKMYLAPLEGITGHIYRSVVNEMFGDSIDKYYTPFLMPHIKKPMTSKDINEILPENNKDMNLVVQILTNDSKGFSFLESAIRDYGYDEINLNLGCPSPTVCNKGRGSGFLAYTDEVDRFLDDIFSNAKGKISVKTRIGADSPEEFTRILEIYNKYPIYELTIHPRIRREMYNGVPHLDVFKYALSNSKNPVCYNGDIVDKASFYLILNTVQSEKQVDFQNDNQMERGCNFPIMVGRGMIMNPALIRELKGGEAVIGEELSIFLRRLREEYTRVFDGPTPVLFKMKEVWSYMRRLFPNDEKLIKKLLKTKSLSEYLIIEKQIL